jgi:peptidoglycan hydrolase CwlO-like protein
MKKVILSLDKLHLILIGIILVGVVLFLINRNSTTSSHLSNPHQPQIDSLFNVIENYNRENSILREKFMYYDSLSKVYSLEIDSLTIDINKKRKLYAKQIKNINTFSPTELYQFITNRYK